MTAAALLNGARSLAHSYSGILTLRVARHFLRALIPEQRYLCSWQLCSRLAYLFSIFGLSHQGAEISIAIQPANGNSELFLPVACLLRRVGARCLRRSGMFPITTELRGNSWDFWGRRRRDQAAQDCMNLGQKCLRTTV